MDSGKVRLVKQVRPMPLAKNKGFHEMQGLLFLPPSPSETEGKRVKMKKKVPQTSI
jgi:hypothetical protein